ncbi:putative helicase, DEAD-box superfamily [Pseudoloma neurophilia]|uniref:Putative helicase, DEAD-box superfamily n=1 Tax=Pseudoloma neurophilia TaxID=146866 RepID=A0A0R0LU63_9MICR|nr:putative helicase, DEAD-box superfamily [Pseudoloma neurophilia]
MSGRAGRRGHDTIGNVIYMGISPDNLIRLNQSKETIEKPYTIDCYACLWFEKSYLKNLLNHPFTYLPDSFQSSENLSENLSDNLWSAFIENVKKSLIREDSSLKKEFIREDSIREDIRENTSLIREDVFVPDNIATLSDIKNLIKNSHVTYQYINLLNILLKYGFIMVCSFNDTFNENSIIFKRTTWGDVLVSNELADPLLFLILLRSNILNFSNMSKIDFVNLLCHFISVRTVDLNSFNSDDDENLLLKPLSKEITTFLKEIENLYPLKHPFIKIPSFLNVNHLNKCDYILDFYKNGYGSFIKKYSLNSSDIKKKESLNISEGDLWRSVDSFIKLLESLIDILEGDEKKLTKDVWDIMRIKLKNINA